MDTPDKSPLSEEQLEELFTLAWAVRDDALTPEQAARLEQLIREDPAALTVYLELIGLLAGLRWNLSASNDPELPALLPGLDQALDERAADRKRRLPGRPFWVSRFAALVLVGVGIAGLAGLVIWQRGPHADRPDTAGRDVAAAESFATLMRADDCDWVQPSASDGPRAGRTLRVRTGLAELQFADGVSVLLEGPAEFDVRSAKGGFLHRGRLIAMVPPAVNGFTIDTANAIIVDHGTEFGVSIGGTGETDVNVLKGRVSVQPVSDAEQTQPAAQFLMLAGESRRISSDGTVNSTHSTLQQGPITGESARASTQFPYVSEPINAVNDSGLIVPSNPPGGAGHSVNVTPSPNKWLSQTSPVDTERWLVIELPDVYEIDRFHVWNYNDGMGSSRGIRKVVVQYSATDPDGKDNTLGEFEFAKAASDGFEVGREYLGQDFSVAGSDFKKPFRAKYIRLAIQTNWSGKPQDGYGLSEIQFYGRKVPAAPAVEARLPVGVVQLPAAGRSARPSPKPS